MAFGEFIPGDIWFPSLRTYFLGSHRAFIPGTKGPEVRQIGSLKLGLQICYESLFPSFSRILSQKGMDVLVNITNDSWFGPWSEPYQHLWMTLARGIETRTPVIRLSNTGFSVAMESNGQRIAHSPLHQQWTQVVSVPYKPSSKLSVFSQWGYRINGVLLLSAFLCILGWFILKRLIIIQKK